MLNDNCIVGDCLFVFKVYFYFMCLYVLLTCMSAPCACGADRGLKRVSDGLRLELEASIHQCSSLVYNHSILEAQEGGSLPILFVFFCFLKKDEGFRTKSLLTHNHYIN